MTQDRGIRFGQMEQAILDASGTLFEQQGYNRTSLQDIAEALGMARASLYHYFDNREQILVAGIDALTSERDELLDQVSASTAGPTDRLELLVRGYGRLIADNPVWHGILFRDAPALPTPVRDRDARSRTAHFEALTAVIREGVEGGDFRELDEDATATTMISILGGLQGEYVAEASLSLSDMTELAVEILLSGILEDEPRPGTPFERGLEMIESGLSVIRSFDPSA